MKIEWNSVKRLGLGAALVALVGAGGLWRVRAADPQPLYHVARDAAVGRGVRLSCWSRRCSRTRSRGARSVLASD